MTLYDNSELNSGDETYLGFCVCFYTEVLLYDK
jgi:hypothetical protein